MTAFDLVVIGVIGLSTLLAFVRGFVRVVVSLAALIVAAVAAIHFSEPVGAALPEFGGGPAARYAAAFALIAIAVLVVGAVVGWLLSRLVRAIGLGFLDRLLGAVVGVARGVLFVVLAVLLAGLTDLPRQDWWQNAYLAPPLVTAALSLKRWLPKAWAERLDYGKAGRPNPAPRTGA
ncbi:MAG TPA: CvpA family protein [Casimicrobiaceae bacterium]|nr:CvpA family protein [Casimicrobiaceae bacterium]